MKFLGLIFLLIIAINSVAFSDELQGQMNESISRQVKLQGEKKSPFKALLFSGLIPGTGEFYLGAPKRGATFLGLAAVGWGSYFFTGSKIDSYQEEYEEVAYLYAGITNPQYGYDDATYKLLGKWESSDYYRERFDENYSGIEWNWKRNPEAEAKWQDYRKARGNKVDSENLQKGLKGGVIFLHAISALDALITTRLHNRSLKNVTFDVDLKERDNPTLRLALTRMF